MWFHWYCCCLLCQSFLLYRCIAYLASYELICKFLINCLILKYAIDTGASVLGLCHQNLVQNNVTNNVSVHELDWFNCEKELQHSSSLCSSGMEDRYKWSHSEFELLRKTSIILASDGKSLSPIFANHVLFFSGI